ncbi:septin-5 isoform X1 [Astyanax mexicanus]|uniref:septin-5 isoform X1 n=1 Tax=Astyanax mexicanus TaxID=7994 RepID=UPI0020CB041E|nr:septin-5 isoform X1 [Astyanax mexicanus]
MATNNLRSAIENFEELFRRTLFVELPTFQQNDINETRQDDGEHFPDSISMSAESEVDDQPTAHTACPTSPLSQHKWVQVDSQDFENSPKSPARPDSACGNADPYDYLVEEEKECVGFARLVKQVQRNAVRQGFEFTLMVVGESGLGKSTLINSLFLQDLYKDRPLSGPRERMYQTVAITKKTVDIVEKGVKLRLNLVDTPGFGDSMNSTNSWKPVLDYVEQQFKHYHIGEASPNRKNLQDHRVHCCLYFISSFGHGLKPIDVQFMKALHRKVNIVPVLAKADCLTPSEIQRMKVRILKELDENDIKIFQFPECDPNEDELYRQQDLEIKKSIPFAVVGSNTTVEHNGKRIRARLYPWGVVEVENPAHCDFVHLRNMLVRTHMQDLKDTTDYLLYENYRMQLMCQNQAH